MNKKNSYVLLYRPTHDAKDDDEILKTSVAMLYGMLTS